jgi:predicted RNA-binding Zn-ribbon protein involved in translation (DUF1610 family)
MSRLATCKGCGKKLQPDEKYVHSSKAYCKDCYDSIHRDGEEYKTLIDFICTNYEIERPTGLMLKQIKEYKNEYSYSYAAMTYTLWYAKEILSKQFIERYGVALIKHYYNEAKSFYTDQEKIKNQMMQLENVEIKTKVVKRKSNSNLNNTNSSLINLENLLEDGDTH